MLTCPQHYRLLKQSSSGKKLSAGKLRLGGASRKREGCRDEEGGGEPANIYRRGELTNGRCSEERRCRERATWREREGDVNGESRNGIRAGLSYASSSHLCM